MGPDKIVVAIDISEMQNSDIDNYLLRDAVYEGIKEYLWDNEDLDVNSGEAEIEVIFIKEEQG